MKCLFIVFATITTLLSYTRQRLYATKHIFSLNKAIAMRFSQNKAWYLVLNTWYSLSKNPMASIFNILFQGGPFLFDSPRIMYISSYRNTEI